MRKLTVNCLLVALVMLLAILPAPAGAAALTELGQEPAQRTVTLARTTDGALRGVLAVPVQSDVNADGLRVSYLATGNVANRGVVEAALANGSGPKLRKERVAEIRLSFALPTGSSPLDLNGLVNVQPVLAGKANGDPLRLRVIGAGPALVGVSVVPEKLTIAVVDRMGPFGTPDHKVAEIQLVGPGVPYMFAPGQEKPSFELLLRSEHGDEVSATLTELEQSSSNPDLATGKVEIDGTLGVGKYEGTTPISSLSPSAPKLSISIESGDSIVPAVFVVFLGTMLGGALYLASSRKRRKELLRDRLKSLLGRYEEVHSNLSDEFGQDGLPVWSLARYLGKESVWYRIEWNAIPAFDGVVQTAWSEIHWARDEPDLDEASKRVEEIGDRLRRWLTVAEGVIALEKAAKLKPADRAGQPWKKRSAVSDTAFLLELTRRIEPPDDKATEALIDRIDRQARWHTLLAKAWNAFTTLEDHIGDAATGGLYDDNDRDAVAGIGLPTIDCDGSPEPKRDSTAQIKLEQRLSQAMRTIQGTYKGDPEDLELKGAGEGLQRATQPGLVLGVYEAGHISAAVDTGLQEANVIDGERVEPQAPKRIDTLRGSSAADHNGERLPPAVGSVLRRDIPWSIATALASSIVYVPIFYTSTWGTPADYASAFAAGFAGKVAVNWAATPLFQSLRSTRSTKPAEPSEKPAAPEGDKPKPEPPAKVVALPTPVATNTPSDGA